MMYTVLTTFIYSTMYSIDMSKTQKMTTEQRVEYDVNIGMTILKLEKHGNFTHEEAMKMFQTLIFT